MDTVTATFSIPDWIEQGLKNGNYIRVGGVIRDAQTKHLVAMLREAASILSQVGSVASILNLGVSVMGFAIVIKRLGEIEQRLKKVQKDVKQLHDKFDLSVYANFQAALDLARDSLTMDRDQHRINMAYLAINRFLEAQHTYIGYVDTALEEDIQIADEYLSSLFLTYIARSRCYLELAEIKSAIHCLQEGAEVVRIRVKKYVDKMFPYLNKEERDKFDKNHSMLLPDTYITVNGVITGVLGGWTRVASTISVLPELSATEILQAITPLELLGMFSPKKQEKPQFPEALSKIEAMLETQERFEAYQAEIQAISQIRISFHDWLKLAPSETKPDGAELMYIIPSKPLDLAIS